MKKGNDTATEGNGKNHYMITSTEHWLAPLNV